MRMCTIRYRKPPVRSPFLGELGFDGWSERPLGRKTTRAQHHDDLACRSTSRGPKAHTKRTSSRSSVRWPHRSTALSHHDRALENPRKRQLSRGRFQGASPLFGSEIGSRAHGPRDKCSKRRIKSGGRVKSRTARATSCSADSEYLEKHHVLEKSRNRIAFDDARADARSS